MDEVTLIFLTHAGNVSKDSFKDKPLKGREATRHIRSVKDAYDYFTSHLSKPKHKNDFYKQDGLFMKIPDNFNIYWTVDPYSSGRCTRPFSEFEDKVCSGLNKMDDKYYNKLSKSSDKYVDGIITKLDSTSDIINTTLQSGIYDDYWNMFISKKSMSQDIINAFSDYHMDVPQTFPDIKSHVSKKQYPGRILTWRNSSDPTFFKIQMLLSLDGRDTMPEAFFYEKNGINYPRENLIEKLVEDVVFNLHDLIYGKKFWPGLSEIFPDKKVNITFFACDPSIERVIPKSLSKKYSKELQVKKTKLNDIWRNTKMTGIVRLYGKIPKLNPRKVHDHWNINADSKYPESIYSEFTKDSNLWGIVRSKILPSSGHSPTITRNYPVSIRKGDETGCKCLSICKVRYNSVPSEISSSFKSAKSRSNSSFKSAKSGKSKKYSECLVSDSCRRKYKLKSSYDKCIPGETMNRQYLQRKIGQTKKKKKIKHKSKKKL